MRSDSAEETAPVGSITVDYPDSEAVLSHGFRFRPAWWTPRVPAGWGSFLERLPAEERGYHRIARADLLAAATDHGLPQALLAGYVWGTGSSAFLVGRRARVFRANDNQYINDTLNVVASTLRGGNAVEAYASMLRGQSQSLKYLGPSFFTKFLYAADSHGGKRGRALILDQFVAVALNALHDWGIPRYGPWEPTTYERWLDLAHSIADAASVEVDGDVRADAIEMAYFNYGRQIAAKR